MLRVTASNLSMACLLRSLRSTTDVSRRIGSIAPTVLHHRPHGHDIDRETLGDGGSSGVAACDGQRRAFGTRQISQKKKDMQKNAKKEGHLRQQQKGSSNEEKIAFMSKILDAKPPPKPELTPEEKQRNMEIGKRYNRMMAKEHNERNADYTMKINLMHDAINNLPELLQHAARQKDHNPPPTNRKMATYTPPIPGFNARDHVEVEDSDLDRRGMQDADESR